MSNTNYTSGFTPNRTGARSPTYAEALKAAAPARPAPINTIITRGSTENANGTGGTVSSGYHSPAYGSNGSASTAATSLFTPNIWSPVPNATQSATMPKKLSWENMTSQIPPPYGATPASSSQPQSRIATPTTSTPKSGLGLGLQVHGGTHLAGPSPLFTTSTADSPLRNVTSGSPYKYRQPEITEAQTSPYNAANCNASSYPLPQFPFGTPREVADQPRILPTDVYTSSYGVSVNAPSQGLATPSRQRPSGLTDDFTAHADVVSDTDSVYTNPFAATSTPARGSTASSVCTSPFSSVTPRPDNDNRENDDDEPTWDQEAHSKSFFKESKSLTGPMGSTFAEARASLKALNPSQFHLPKKSRLVCIKTDYVDNIGWSVKRGIWPSMDKVGERIMRLWEAREDPDDKVFLLFSINGHKSYCGLAEMSGPFTLGGNLENFDHKDDGSITWGTMPVTWMYVKNVSYGWFTHIVHSHNDQPIVNMWNGMHFPLVAGNKVLEIYVKRPHFNNVIAWIPDGPYNPYMTIAHAGQIDPDLSRPTPSRARNDGPRRPALAGVGRGASNTDNRTTELPPNRANTSRTQALTSNNWRQPQQPHGGLVAPASSGETTPTPNLQTRDSAAPPQVNLTPPNLDGPASPFPRGVQVIPAYVDENGNLRPLEPTSPAAQPQTSSPNIARRPGQQQPGMYPTPYPLAPQSQTSNAQVMRTTDQQLGDMQQTVSSSSMRGGIATRGVYRGGNRGVLPGGILAFRPGKDAEPINTTPNVVARSPFGQAASQAVQQLRSQVGMHDDPFTSPRHAQSMNNLRHPSPSMPMSVPTGNSPVFQRAASSTSFVPQSFAAQTPTTPYFGTNVPGAGFGGSFGAAGSFTPSYGASSSPDFTAFGQVTFDDRLTPQKDPAAAHVLATRERFLQANRAASRAEQQLAQFEYKQAMKKWGMSSLSPSPETSEAGGLNAWVSTSSLEKQLISPVASLSGSVLGAGCEGAEVKVQEWVARNSLGDAMETLGGEELMGTSTTSLGGGVSLE